MESYKLPSRKMMLSTTDSQWQPTQHEGNPLCKRFRPAYYTGQKPRGDSQDILAGNPPRSCCEVAGGNMAGEAGELWKSCAQRSTQSFPVVLTLPYTIDFGDVGLEREGCVCRPDSFSVSDEREQNCNRGLHCFPSSADAEGKAEDCEPCCDSSNICYASSKSALTPAESNQDSSEAASEADNVVQIHSLPNEVLLHVFMFLSPRELCRHVTAVCWRWHNLAYSRCLWTKLDVSSSGVTGQQLCGITQRVPGAVRDLNIADLQGLSDASLAAVMKNCPNLVHLDFSGVCNLSISMMRSVLLFCPSLQSLNLSRCCKLDQGIMQEIGSRAGPKLKRISLDGSCLGDDSLSQMMRSLPGLTHLSLDHMPAISEGVLQQIIHRYSGSLEALTLDGRNVTDRTIQPLSFCHRLQSLSISCCENMTQFSFHVLTRLQKLKKLVLRKGHMLHTWGLMELFSTSTLKGLSHLDLTQCAQLDDEGVQAISQTCADNLKSLCLSWCLRVSDEGLIHVALSCLHLVRMELTGLHRLQGSWLPTAVQTMSSLSFVSFQLCQNVRVSVMEEASRNKPDLTILNYYGDPVGHRSQG